MNCLLGALNRFNCISKKVVEFDAAGIVAESEKKDSIEKVYASIQDTIQAEAAQIHYFPSSKDKLKIFFQRGVCLGFYKVDFGNQNSIPIFIVTLKNTPERILRTIASLKHAKFSATFCVMSGPDSAVYNEYQNQVEESSADENPKLLSVGELGCLASHVWILNHMKRQKIESAMILEDDCDFTRTFHSFDANRDLILLGCSDWHFSKRLQQSSYYDANIKDGRVCGSFAYFVTQKGAVRIIEACSVKHMNDLKAASLKPYDHAFHNAFPKVRCLWPPLFIADRTTSTIRNIALPNYRERCLTGLNFNNYISVSISKLLKIDCECWTAWPKLCPRCSGLNRSLVDELIESLWSQEIVLDLCQSLFRLVTNTGLNEQFVVRAPKLLSPSIDMPRDTAVAIAYFNPCGYSRPLQNILKTVKQFEGIAPVFAIELLYGAPGIPKKAQLTELFYNSSNSGLCPEGVNNTGKNGIKIVSAKSVLFHKENLWNILSRFIPKQYSKIAFLDADIILDCPKDWISRTSFQLQNLDIVQIMSSVKFQEIPQMGQKCTLSNQILLAAATKLREMPFDFHMNYPSPGYGVAVNRSWLKKIGGFVEMGLSGGGDLFCLGLLCDTEHVKQTTAYLRCPYAHKDIERFLFHSKGTRVGSVPCEGTHLFHGFRKDRQYESRYEILENKTFTDFFKNSDGVIECRKPEDNLLQYFASRNEDSSMI